MSKPSAKTKAQLIAELEVLNQRVAELEALVAECPHAEALHESEERYRRIAQTLTDYIYTVRVEGGRAVETTHGPACVAVTGYASEDFAANPDLWLQMVDGEDRAAVLEQARRLLDGQDAQPVEHRLTRKDGVMRWVRNTPVPCYDSGGKLLAYDGLIQDITERKQSDEALQRSQQLFSSIFHVNPAATILSLWADGKCVDANEAYARLVGYTREELIGKTTVELNIWTSPEERQRVVTELAQKGHLEDVELSLRRKNGEIVNTVAAGEVITLEGQRSILSFFFNITERKRAEEALAQERNLLRTLIDSMPDRIYAKDAEGRFILKNEADARAMGASSPSEVIGKTDFDYYPRELAERFHNDDLQVIHSGQSLINREEPGVDHEGNARWVLTTKVPLRDSQGRVTGLVGMGRDVTERKKAEEALRDSEARYRRLFEDAVLGIFQSTPEGEAIAVNPAFARMFGYESPDEVYAIVKNVGTDLFADPQRRSEIMHLMAENPDLKTFENLYRRKDGSTFTGTLHVWPVNDTDGQLLHLEGFVEDITERKQVEEALRESEATLRSLFRAAPVGIGLVVNRVILQANDRLCEMTGYSREELVGQSARIVYPSDEDYDYVGQEKYRQIGERGTGSVETRWLRKDGTIIQIILSSTPLNPDDLSAGVTFTALDITERKQAEEELRTAQRQLSNALKMAHLGPWELDIDKDLFTFNDYFYDVFRTTAEEVGGYTMPREEYARRFVHPGDASLVGTENQKAIETTDPNYSRQLEHRIIYADGSTGYISVRFSIVKDDKGRTVKTYGVNQDITERKQAMAELAETQALLRSAIEQSPVPMVVAKPDGTITIFNQACVEFLGIADEPGMEPGINLLTMKRSWQDLDAEGNPIPPDEAPLALAIQGKATKGMEMKARRKDGTERWEVVDGVPIYDKSGNLIAGLIIFPDVTERTQMVETLRKREAHQALVLDSLPMAFYVAQPSGDYGGTWVSAQIDRITGFSPERFTGDTHLWASRLHPEDRDRVLGQFGDLPNTGSLRVEYRWQVADGRYSWILDQAVLTRDANGHPEEIVGTWLDITERKRAEEALRESEERYRIISGLTSDLTYAARVELDGTTAFEWAAGALIPITGYTLDELEALGGWSVVIHHDDIPLAIQHLQTHLANQPDVAEYRIMTKSGEVRWLRDYGYPVWDETQKRVARIIGAAQDITERKRAEDLIRAERDLALALGGTPNLEKGLRLCLNTALLLSGMDGGGVYRVDETSGALNLVAHQGLSSKFIVATSHYAADSPNAQLVMAGEPVYAEYAQVGIPLDEIRRHESLHAVAFIPIRHEDRAIGCLNVTSYTMPEVPKSARDALETIAAQIGDVIVRMEVEAELRQYRGHLEELVEQRTAELKAANEQLLILTRAKDDFVSNVSHELRTPISSLKLRQRLLRSHPDQLDQHLDVIRRETDRLAQTIEELLQLSRLDQRRIEFHPVLIDLNQLVGQYMADRAPIANDKGLALSFQGEPELPGVMADAGLLGQALSILLTNAINYTPAGGHVLVRTHARQDADKRWIGFSIADTGPGILPDEQPRLFDRFFRGQIGRKSGVPGTGLGLAIAHEIVGRHRGNIEVESGGAPGHGATFRVWIPIGGEADDESVGG